MRGIIINPSEESSFTPYSDTLKLSPKAKRLCRERPSREATAISEHRSGVSCEHSERGEEPQRREPSVARRYLLFTPNSERTEAETPVEEEWSEAPRPSAAVVKGATVQGATTYRVHRKKESTLTDNVKLTIEL